MSITNDHNSLSLAVIGLGYVGLPLAVRFARNREVIAFDIDVQRISLLQKGIDSTGEVDRCEFDKATGLKLTSDFEELRDTNCKIITVPTPIDEFHRPNLEPLLIATETIGQTLKFGDIVIYESTVYPGCTEEECVPVLEKHSGLRFNRDFFCGYSPERINPGDKEHRLSDIVKVTAGSTPQVADLVDRLYQSIVSAGTHKVESIKIAEAAKVIENTQRDLNIALVNELTIIFNKLGIDTQAVLEAAGSKWNFIPFQPGLVGGHCIGVDPYYLTHKAESIGYSPEVILAGRRLNDGMGAYVAYQLIDSLISRGIEVDSSRVLIMGFTFKENCPDIRNTKVIDILSELSSKRSIYDVYDPWVDKEEAKIKHGLALVTEPSLCAYDAVIIAVGHDCFKEIGADKIKSFLKPNGFIYDLKRVIPKEQSDLTL